MTDQGWWLRAFTEPIRRPRWCMLRPRSHLRVLPVHVAAAWQRSEPYHAGTARAPCALSGRSKERHIEIEPVGDHQFDPWRLGHVTLETS